MYELKEETKEAIANARACYTLGFHGAALLDLAAALDAVTRERDEALNELDDATRLIDNYRRQALQVIRQRDANRVALDALGPVIHECNPKSKPGWWTKCEDETCKNRRAIRVVREEVSRAE